jgi:hypothetical protein
MSVLEQEVNEDHFRVAIFGTVLELFSTWQLAQVRHIHSKPIILLRSFRHHHQEP